MNIDHRGFHYTLEPLLRRQAWRLEALESRLRRANQHVACAAQEQEVRTRQMEVQHAMAPRIDEHGYGWRHLAPCDEVVEHHGDPPPSFDIAHPLAVLKDHQRGWSVFLILSRNIDRPVADRPSKNLRFPWSHLLDSAMRDVVLRDGIRMRFPLGLRFHNRDVR